jgi:tRNA threonylcarbamoyladenosine biosynthesis protein TsaE
MKIDQAWLKDASHTHDFAQQLAQAYQRWCQSAPGATQQALSVSFQGDLGAGKSTFVRAFVQWFLPGQKVKSPTFTLVETYPVRIEQPHAEATAVTFVHFDCYRLADPEELEFLGIRDLLKPPSLALVEWPDKGEGVLPQPDLVCELALAEVENPEKGRVLSLQAHTESGKQWLACMPTTATVN